MTTAIIAHIRRIGGLAPGQGAGECVPRCVGACVLRYAGTAAQRRVWGPGEGPCAGALCRGGAVSRGGLSRGVSLIEDHLLVMGLWIYAVRPCWSDDCARYDAAATSEVPSSLNFYFDTSTLPPSTLGGASAYAAARVPIRPPAAGLRNAVQRGPSAPAPALPVEQPPVVAPAPR